MLILSILILSLPKRADLKSTMQAADVPGAIVAESVQTNVQDIFSQVLS
jgi:hypothetical protein